MSISAMSSLFAFADLGLGNSILSKVSKAIGQKDFERVRVILSATYGGIISLALLLFPILMLVANFVPWGNVFGLTDASKALEAKHAIIVAFGFFLITIVANLIYKIQIASQEAFAANLWQALGNLVGMCLIMGAVALKLSLSYIVAAFLGGPALIWIINSAVFFKKTGKTFSPRLASIDIRTFLELAKESSEFLLLGIILTLAVSLDVMVVSNTLGLESAATFSIALRASTLLSLVPMMMYMPLWAANGEAIGRGDFDWVRKTVSRMTLICPAMTLLMGLPIIIGSGPIFRLWLRSDVGISKVLLAGLFAWALLQCFAAPRFMVLNSMMAIKPQIVMQMGFLLLSIPAKIFFLKHVGLSSLPWINCLVYVIAVLPALEFIYRRRVSAGLSTNLARAAC